MAPNTGRALLLSGRPQVRTFYFWKVYVCGRRWMWRVSGIYWQSKTEKLGGTS